MNKCPECSHEWPDDKRAKGGKARWRGMSKAQRRRAASDAAKARWARTPNDELTRTGAHGASNATNARPPVSSAATC